MLSLDAGNRDDDVAQMACRVHDDGVVRDRLTADAGIDRDADWLRRRLFGGRDSDDRSTSGSLRRGAGAERQRQRRDNTGSKYSQSRYATHFTPCSSRLLIGSRTPKAPASAPDLERPLRI